MRTWASLVDDPGLLGRMRRQWPWLMVVGIALAGLAMIAIGSWRAGAGVVGAAMLAGGIFRLTLEDPGIVIVRNTRWLDLVFYFGLGFAIMGVAMLVPDPHHCLNPSNAGSLIWKIWGCDSP
ncbi:MAG: DUF3017 domain-containing protein [Propionibacteriaceae bacterium]|nr:DUF3017 domain-containing protein [Propionibacteriaceae bacterium]